MCRLPIPARSCFRHDPETSKRQGDAQHILDLPDMGYHQHWTRSLAFSPDDTKLFVSVGSSSNISIERDERRAVVLVPERKPNAQVDKELVLKALNKTA
jgi:glucose/arabinose dehydrogenase